MREVSELAHMVDNAPMGMFRVTEHGRIVYANHALCALTGYSLDELQALGAANLYSTPAERERLRRIYLEQGIQMGIRAMWRRKDDSTFCVGIYTVPFEHPFHGACFDITVVDVSELVAQREEVERTATTLDLVVRQLPAIYWVVDHDLRITRTGGAVEQVLGYRADLFIGHRLPRVHESEPGSVDPTGYHRRALAGEIVTYATEYRNKLLEITLGPYRVDGEIIGAIGTGIDNTAARLLERRMVDAQRAESLGVLAGGLAHDFNNLLVAILGNADLALRDLPRGTPGRHEVENVRHAGRRAAELTDQLLAYAGRRSAPTTTVDLGPLVEELLRIAAPTIPAAIVPRVDIPCDALVRADASQLRQAMLNLLTNARDALAQAERGTIAVSATRLHHDGTAHEDDVLTPSAGDYIAIDVADDGPGIQGDHRPRVFDPFYTTKPTGHGLGLAAVLGIVRSHSGGLRLRTKPGEGATFTLFWPSAEPEPVHARDVSSSLRTVLVVDDEVLVRDVVARMIEDLGYAAITAPDGPSALAMIETRPVDVILVDLSMPQMSGADVIRAVRERRPNLPIILCSGYDRDRRGPVAADAYLPKPFQLEVLEQTLARLMAQSLAPS